MIRNGYVFTKNGMMYVVTGSAVSGSTQEVLYLCQEMSEGGRLIAWSEADVRGLSVPVEQKISRSPVETEARIPAAEICNHEIEEVSSEADFDISKLEAFLETDSPYKKLEILQRMKADITESILDAMAISLDFENETGGKEEKYFALERYLKTRIRYEGRR